MGLLDALFQGSQGSGGGLLDFLRNNAMNQQMPGLAPQDTAQYAPMGQAPQFAPVAPQQNAQPSPLDTAQYPFGPMGAPSQANAQMPPQQPPPVIQAQPMQQAQPAQAQLPQAQDSSPGIMDRLSGLARPGSIMGAIMGAPNPANLTVKALVAKGVDPVTAQAAIGNPDLLKTLITQTYGQTPHTQVTDKDGNVWDVNQQTGQRTIALAAPKDNFNIVQTGQDPLGQKTYQKINKSTGEMTPLSGGDGGDPGLPSFGSLLAQGVKYDPNKTGDEYMAQFGPEVQSAAKAYINGDVMPTGNARMKSIASFSKTVAQKYGQDKGIPVSDSEYDAKRKMKIDLASSGNSSMGGILSNGESSFKHLAEYTGSVADQGNASHNFPGGSMLAHAQNYIGNTGGGSDTQAKVKAVNDNLGHYGQESTKFYAGTGGGVEERLNALKEMNATTTSGEEAAAYAEKEKSLMLDRLNTKFQEIRNTLGEAEANRVISKHMPDIQQNMATIDANIARLRGSAPAAANATPALKPGQSTTIGGVSIKRVN